MLIANVIQYQKKCILVLQRLSDVDPDEWPWDLELVLVNINKLICKLVEGLRFFKAEYNYIRIFKNDSNFLAQNVHMDMT